MIFLRTNTATRIRVGPFLDKGDGVTPETSLTVTNCKLTMVVDTAGVPTLVLDTNPTASGGSNDMVHITGDDAGMYDLELTAADTNYLGRGKVIISDAANHCPVWEDFMIVPAMIYDSVFLGTDRLDANVTHVADQSQTARDIGASVLLSSGTGTGQLKLASGYVAMTLADIADPTNDSASALGIIWAGTATFANGTITFTGGSNYPDHAANIVVFLRDGTNARGKGRWLASYSGSGEVWNVDPAWNSDSETNPSGTVHVIVQPTFKTPTGVLPLVEVSKVAGVSQSPGDLVAKVDAIDDLLDTEIAALPTAAAIADAVWEEDLTDHSGTGGSVAEALGAAGSAGDPWATALPGAYSSGSAGKIIGDNLNATVGSRASQTSVDDVPTNAELATATANLDTQLDALPTVAELATALAAADDAVLAAIAGQNNLSSAQVQTAAAAALTAYDPPTHAEVTAAIAAGDDATLSAIGALSIPTTGAIADAVHDEVVEGTTTLRQSLRLHNAVLGGKLSGAGTGTETVRDLADMKDVAVYEVDEDGNRTMVTRDLT